MRVKIFITLSVIAFLLCAGGAINRSGVAAAQSPQRSQRKRAARYACPMHPEVTSNRPGKCPKCGMALRVVEDEPEAASVSDTLKATTDDKETAISLRIPDTPVLDQDGKRLNFYTDLVKGKAVAINFIFTTCTTICPPLTATFRRVQVDLGEHVGRDVHLISVSVDPTTDVPERLKDFAAKFKAGPGWTFVTGEKTEIDALLKALGAAVADKNDHTPMILVGNDAVGYWTRTYGLAPPSALVRVISEAASRKEK